MIEVGLAHDVGYDPEERHRIAGSEAREQLLHRRLHVGQRLVIPGAAAPSSGSRLNLRPAKLAFARWDGHKHDLQIANLDGSDERLLLERAAGPYWSPDGQRLSIFGDKRVLTGSC